MIFYFSGTGNSYNAAKKLSEVQGEPLISIASELDKRAPVLEYTVNEGELLGFVFPVYAWAPPKIVLEFISQIKVTGGKPYTFSLCTCGDEEGKTTRIVQKALRKNGLMLDSAFSLVMPNNYIIGFDVDPKDLEQKKLKNAELKLSKINAILSEKQKNVWELTPGSLPGLKSALVPPLFNAFGRGTTSFYATESCTQCGFCEKVCPVHTITLKDRPVWSHACTQCLACINRCPVKAIQYGHGTKKKGRYVHPDGFPLQK